VSECKTIQKDQRKSEAGQLELLVEKERMAGGRIRIGDRSKGEEEKKGKGGERRKNSKGVPGRKGDPRRMRERTQTSERGFSCPLPSWGLYR